MHLGLAATQRNWERTHLLSAKTSCSLSAIFLIPPKFPLCSSTCCLPTPTAQLTAEPSFGWKHISLCIPQIWGESVPPHVLVAPASCRDRALPTHPHGPGAALPLSPLTATAAAACGGHSLVHLIMWELMNSPSECGFRTHFFPPHPQPQKRKAAVLWHLFYKPR